MAEAIHFWQGGRRIEARQDTSTVTIHAANVAEANSAANRAGIQLETVESAAPGLMRARIAGDLDSSMDRLRAESNVVHHVYRDVDAPDVEYLITDSFFIKFKPDTPAQRIREFFQAERLVIEQDLGNQTYLARVTDGTGRNPIRTANAASTRTDVEYAEPNLVRQLTRFSFIPPDALFTKRIADTGHATADRQEHCGNVAAAGVGPFPI